MTGVPPSNTFVLLWQQKAGKQIWRWRVKEGICQQLTGRQNSLPLPLYCLVILKLFYNRIKIETAENKTLGRVNHECHGPKWAWGGTGQQGELPPWGECRTKSVFSWSSLFSKCESSPWKHQLLREQKPDTGVLKVCSKVLRKIKSI